MTSTNVGTAVLTAVMLLACSSAEQRTPFEPGGPMFARTLANPGAVWEFAGALSNGTVSGIVGDGRSASGSGYATGSTGAYQTGVCGVSGSIFVQGSASGDATIDPDGEYSPAKKCARRYFSLTLAAGVVQSGPFTNALAVSQMAVGEQKLATMRWGVALSGCGRLVFGVNAAGDNQVVITRTPNDALGRRSWTVETRAPHTAECENPVGASYVLNGVTHVLPYSLRITEIY